MQNKNIKYTVLKTKIKTKKSKYYEIKVKMVEITSYHIIYIIKK